MSIGVGAYLSAQADQVSVGTGGNSTFNSTSSTSNGGTNAPGGTPPPAVAAASSCSSALPSGVTTAPLVCSDPPQPFGGWSCTGATGLPQLVQKYEDLTFGKRIWGAYHGMGDSGSTPGVGGPLALPTCNINQGEGADVVTDVQYRQNNGGAACPNCNHNWLPPGLAYNCGKVCGFNISTSQICLPWVGCHLIAGSITSDASNGQCSWEYGQKRGGFIQMENYFRLQVYNEVQNRSVTLTSFNGSYPCQAIAADIMKLSTDIACITQNGIRFAGGPSAANAMSCKFAQAPAASSGGTLDPTSFAESMQGDSATLASCGVTNANNKLVSLYVNLVDCEIWSRSAKADAILYANPNSSVSTVTNDVKNQCQGAINDGSCSDDGCRNRKFSLCYANWAATYLKNMYAPWATPNQPPPHGPSSGSNTGSSNEEIWAFIMGGLVRYRGRGPRKGHRSKS